MDLSLGSGSGRVVCPLMLCSLGGFDLQGVPRWLLFCRLRCAELFLFLAESFPLSVLCCRKFCFRCLFLSHVFEGVGSRPCHRRHFVFSFVSVLRRGPWDDFRGGGLPFVLLVCIGGEGRFLLIF